MVSRLPPQCLACARWVSPFERDDADALADEPTQTCTAFPLPGGVPNEIWNNRFDHRNPFPGDHGLQWESLDGADFPQWAMAEAT